jgi:acid phosphatase family membrane protein YuiD
MIDTGKTLTAEQIAAVRAKLNTPVLFLSGGMPMGGSETVQQMVHRFALASGLPEIPGYYGANLETGIIYSS